MNTGSKFLRIYYAKVKAHLEAIGSAPLGTAYNISRTN